MVCADTKENAGVNKHLYTMGRGFLSCFIKQIFCLYRKFIIWSWESFTFGWPALIHVSSKYLHKPSAQNILCLEGTFCATIWHNFSLGLHCGNLDRGFMGVRATSILKDCDAQLKWWARWQRHTEVGSTRIQWNITSQTQDHMVSKPRKTQCICNLLHGIQC